MFYALSASWDSWIGVKRNRTHDTTKGLSAKKINYLVSLVFQAREGSDKRKRSKSNTNCICVCAYLSTRGEILFVDFQNKWGHWVTNQVPEPNLNLRLDLASQPAGALFLFLLPPSTKADWHKLGFKSAWNPIFYCISPFLLYYLRRKNLSLEDKRDIRDGISGSDPSNPCKSSPYQLERNILN